ncbi:hypothetical protein MTBBW1_410077 [Desulfamplus magnetovallimortis]|uniref:Uncharacterized protein n=1 Tax=Desulfamplus magnetovallimortis TaxID=1246637 RepID=A0A1W1HH66_9BACT|nr:hypothetical protein MTBBW1_410077 [Desulfamplus magnetovallimortis]
MHRFSEKGRIIYPEHPFDPGYPDSDKCNNCWESNKVSIFSLYGIRNEYDS